MKQKLLIVVIAIVVLGVGFGGGFILADKKGKTQVAAMETKVQQSEAASRARISSYDNVINDLSGKLQIAQLELQTLKTQGVQPAAEESQQTTQQQSSSPTIAGQSTTELPDGPPDGVNTKYYTIQSGDSFWSIAQKQLGNGSRYNEIIKLNPRLTDKSRLVVGSKILVPAK